MQRLRLACLVIALSQGLWLSCISAETSRLDKLSTTLRKLRRPPSALAISRARAYVGGSSAASIEEGLGLLLHSQLGTRAAGVRKRASRLTIDGRNRDWRSWRLTYTDPPSDLTPIDAAKPAPGYLSSDDIKSASFLIDNRHLYFMIELWKAPSRKSHFYYALNLMTPKPKLVHTLSWTHSGFYVQYFNPVTGTWVSSKRNPASARVAAGRVIEGRVPLKLLPHLPEHFYVEAVSWQEERNVYDSFFFQSTHSRAGEELYNYALELFMRYAELTELAPDDPMPLAQAIVDAYAYRLGTAEVRDLVVRDGLQAIADRNNTTQYSFSGQTPLAQLSFRDLLVWANRSLYYGVNGSKWKLKETLSQTGGLFNEEVYRHLFLAPDALMQARSIVAKNNLLADGDLPKTLRGIEAYLQTVWKYRAPLDFMELLAAKDPANWQSVYEEVKYEVEHDLTALTYVGLDPILKWWNQSQSFQLAFLDKHNFYYGNCGDAAAIGGAIGKALGIPSIHVHYDAILEDGTQRAVHSFPAYYSSELDRYIGFSSGNNHLFDTLRGGPNDKVFYLNEVPIVSPIWEIESAMYPGSQWYRPSNTCGQIIGVDEWEAINREGVPASDIENCMKTQLR